MDFNVSSLNGNLGISKEGIQSIIQCISDTVVYAHEFQIGEGMTEIIFKPQRQQMV